LYKGTLALKHLEETVRASFFVELDEVFVLQRLEATSGARHFDPAVDSGAFEVKNATHLFRPNDLHRVCHQHEMYGALALDRDGVHTIDTRQERRRIFLQMLEVGQSELA